jgi:ATP-dependent Clp protease ATP-binding subunit ClpB
VEIQVRHLQKLLGDQGIELQMTQAARRALANEGYDPVYGARPLKRTIQRRIQDPLAMHLLTGEFRAGDTVLVEFEDGEYTFQHVAQAEAVTTWPISAPGAGRPEALSE